MRALHTTVLVIATTLTLTALSACGTTTTSHQRSSSAPTSKLDVVDPACSGKKADRVLRYANADAPDHPSTKAAELFARELNEKTNCKIHVDVYPSSVLGDGNEMYQGVKNGTIDFASDTGAFLSSFFPKEQALDLPFMFGSAQEARKFLDGPGGQKMLSELSSTGLKGLGWATGGPRIISNDKHPIRTPSDMKGLKIRVQDGTLWSSLVSALGATPVAMGYTDVYTGLKQGTIDGVDVPAPAILGAKLEEVLRYATVTNHSYNATVIVMNPGLFNKLSSSEQAAVKSSADDATDLQWKLMEQSIDANLAQMEKAGVKITGPDDFDLAAFQHAEKSTYDKLAPIVGADLIEQIQQVSGGAK